MIEIDLKDYLTTTQAAKAIKCSARTLHRVLNRVGIDRVSVEILGRRLIRRDAIPSLKAAYLPFGSKARSAMAQVWGAQGGTQKGVNYAKRARAAKRAEH